MLKLVSISGFWDHWWCNFICPSDLTKGENMDHRVLQLRKQLHLPQAPVWQVGEILCLSSAKKMDPRSSGASPGFPKENGRATFIIKFPVSQIHADGLLYSSLWNMSFNRSMGTFESFPVKINLHFWNCTGQPLFHMHVLLITMTCVSITLFSEKIQACFRHSCLISPDSRLLKWRTRGLFGNCPVTVRSPVPSGIPGQSVSLWPDTTGMCDWLFPCP